MWEKKIQKIPINIENLNAYRKFYSFTLFYSVIIALLCRCGSRDLHDIARSAAAVADN